MQAAVILTGGRLPWEIAISIPEAYIDGWIIACTEYRNGKTFNFARDAFGEYIGFGKDRSIRQTIDADQSGGST